MLLKNGKILRLLQFSGDGRGMMVPHLFIIPFAYLLTSVFIIHLTFLRIFFIRGWKGNNE